MSARTYRTIAAILVTVLSAGSAAAWAQAPEKKYDALLGVWDVKMEDGSREFVWEFALRDGKLTGKYTGASGATDMADLSFEGGTVKFTVTLGGGMLIRYEAGVAEDRLVGTLSLEFGEAAVTGTRRK